MVELVRSNLGTSFPLFHGAAGVANVGKQLFSTKTLTNVGGYLEETSNLFVGLRLENHFQNAE